MTLYIQDENYHFDGFLSGVIVDNKRTAIFSKNGIEDFNLGATCRFPQTTNNLS